uniref:CCHC-type domain-containing protein n=1 Tax=Sinocyclocheilus grahami TaxID=75366 RepID=A0A672PHY8_SINGR
MASLDLQKFLENPSLEQLDSCKKDELLAIASHFQIAVGKQSRKGEIKSVVYNRLVEMNVLGLSEKVDIAVGSAMGAIARSENESEEELMPAAEVDADVRARLPQFEPFSPMSTGSKEGARLKVRLARLQMEAQEKVQIRQAEMDLRLQIRRLEIEAEKQIKMRQLELDAMRIVGGSAAQPDLPRVTTAATIIPAPVVSSTPTVPSAPSVATGSFDVSKHITLVPLFRETEIDSYFSAFERIATSLHWPKELWALLLQCRLVGKALEVFSTLSVEDSLNYETVKLAILRAYELVPEAYRQKFRGHKKNSCQTFVEFAREKSLLFDKWCSATKTGDFDSLRELILLEEFKGCLPERVVVYLNEQKVNALSQAAVLADEFVLTHKGVFSVTHTEKSTTSGPSQSQSARIKSVTSQLKEVRDCFYCHKHGHLIADCPVLRRKQQTQNPKSVALLKTMPMSELSGCTDVLDVSYKPFVMTGFVSLSGKEEDRREISILRDTGAMQSIMVSDILPFSDESYCGSNILVRGIEMQVVPVPLHRVHLDSTLVSGFVRVGIRRSLPMKGITFILGNDLAGGKVVPAPEVTDVPSDCLNSNDVANFHPEVFSACAVTRARSAEAMEQVDLADSLVGHALADDGNIPEIKMNDVRRSNVKSSEGLLERSHSLDLPISRSQIIAAQNNDPSLRKCFSAVISSE